MSSTRFAWLWLILAARCGNTPSEEVQSVGDSRPGESEAPSAVSKPAPDAASSETAPAGGAGAALVEATPGPANGASLPESQPEPTEPDPPDPAPRVEPDAGPPSSAPTFESIDRVDMPEGEPAFLSGSSSFLWSRGIGNWFVTSSGGGVRDASSAEIVPPREESQRAYRVTSSDPPEAVDLWVQLDHPTGRALDLGAYAGLAFWARMNGPSNEVIVAFNLNGRYFDPELDLDTLTTHALEVANDWEYLLLEFGALGVDNTALSSFDFVVGTDGAGFDLWIDDLALLCAGPCP